MSAQYLQENWFTLTLIGIGLAIVIYVIAAKGGQIRKFIDEVTVELKKASWPWDTREKGAKRYKELIDSTLMVAIAMLLLGGYIAFWDFIMVNIVSALIN